MNGRLVQPMGPWEDAPKPRMHHAEAQRMKSEIKKLHDHGVTKEMICYLTGVDLQFVRRVINGTGR